MYAKEDSIDWDLVDSDEFRFYVGQTVEVERQDKMTGNIREKLVELKSKERDITTDLRRYTSHIQHRTPRMWLEEDVRSGALDTVGGNWYGNPPGSKRRRSKKSTKKACR